MDPTERDDGTDASDNTDPSQITQPSTEQIDAADEIATIHLPSVVTTAAATATTKFPAVPASRQERRKKTADTHIADGEETIEETPREGSEPVPLPPMDYDKEYDLIKDDDRMNEEDLQGNDAEDNDEGPGAFPIPGIDSRQISRATFLYSNQDETDDEAKENTDGTSLARSNVVAEAVDEDQLLGELLSRRRHDVVNAENVVTINEEGEVDIKKRAIAVATSVLALIAIAAVITAILVSRSKNAAKQAKLASTIAPQPTAKPANFATTRPTITPRPTAAPVSLLQTFRGELLNRNVSSSHNLDQYGTPQNKAFNWLVNHDNFLNASSPVEDVIDRYVLGVIYYADGGNQWNNPSYFLTYQSICLWNAANITGVFCTASLNNRSHRSQGNYTKHVCHVVAHRCLHNRDSMLMTLCLFLTGYNGLDDFILTKLVLASNSLIGPIPTEVGVLSNLTYLDLGTVESVLWCCNIVGN
jgi:hypothetical protein